MIKGTQAVKGELSFLGEQFSHALRSDQVSSRSVLIRCLLLRQIRKSCPRALRSYGEKIL